MTNPYFKYDWAILYNLGITFAGVLLKHYDEIAQKNRWGRETKTQYAKNYEDNLLPRLQDRPLAEYTAEDFEQVICAISAEKHYKYSTLQHYRRLINHVIAFAVQYEGLIDPLWGMYFSEVLTPKEVAQREDLTLPRSLDPVMVWKMADIIYQSVLSSGEQAGLALLLEAGLRLKEAAGVTFGDLFCETDCNAIPQVFIHNSTKGQTHDLRDGVKTDNGYRTAIISENLALLLIAKQQHAQEILSKKCADTPLGIADIRRMPMVSDKNDLFRHCASPQLTVAFRKLLAKIGYDEKDFLLLQNIVNSQEFTEAVKRVTPKNLGFAEERDPSAYACRRNYNTEMHILGMPPESRQFCMGHKIESSNIQRSDYRNEDLLKQISQLLSMRPYINPSVLDRQTVQTSCYEGKAALNQNFEIPNKKGRLVIEFTGYDLLDPGKISVTFPNGTVVRGRAYTQPLDAPVRPSPDVLYDYLQTHRRARDQAFAAQADEPEGKIAPHPKNK